MKQPVPPIPKELLDYLQDTFPNKLPEVGIDPDLLGILIGQQKVIQHLQARFKAQNKGPAVA